MIFHCDYCNYTFDSMDCHLENSVPDRCPDCGKTFTTTLAPAVRMASEGEAAEYLRIRAEIISEQFEQDNNVHAPV